MSKVKINRANTFEEWRLGTNRIGAGVGDLTKITKNAVIPYTTALQGQNSNTFAGTPATFKVTIQIDHYTATIETAGTGYAVADLVIINGSDVGGVDGENDVTIAVTTLGTNNSITAITVTGVTRPDMTEEVNQLRIDSGSSRTTAALTTTDQTFSGGINELDALQGNVNIKGTKAASLPKSTFASITDAVLQMDTFQGNVTLPTTAQTVSGSLKEHEEDLGTMSFNTSSSSIALVVTAGNHVDLDDTVTKGLNNTKGRVDFLLDELGGKMASDYDGPDNDVISALDSLYNASSLGTLDNTYMRRNGTLPMTGLMELDELGVKVSPNTKPMLFKTGGSDAIRMSIETNGRIGVNKTGSSVAYLVDVYGDLAATKLRYGTDDTDVRYFRTARTTEQEVSTPNNFTGVSKFTKELNIGSDKVYDSTASTGHTFTEWAQDLVGGVFTGNSESGGITATYIDSTGKISLNVANDSHTHQSGNVSDWDEAVQDTIAGMMSTNVASASGMTIAYVDSTGKLTFDVNNPTLAISGDATGSAVMNGLGNTTIAIDLTDESVQDIVGAMVSGNTETGITVDYQDADGTLDFVLTADPIVKLIGDATGQVTLANLATGTYSLDVTVVDDLHSHVVGNIDDFAEEVMDVVGTMVSAPGEQESGISVVYDDNNNKLSFDVLDPTITLAGDVTGSGTMSNLGSFTINTSMNPNMNAEAIEDIVGAMISGNTETGIAVTYDDRESGSQAAARGKLDFTLTADPTIVLGGDLSGSVQLTNLTTGNHTLNATINENSIELGTDTTGDFVHQVTVSGNGLTISGGTGEDASVVVTSNATSASTANTIVYRDGSKNFSCNIMTGTATSAYYADLAENYLADADYPVGTVLAFGGEHEVTISQQQNDSKVIGVVSEHPAYLMNSGLEGDHVVTVALKGRVPMRVMGPVTKGDVIASDGNGNGYAHHNAYWNEIIGKSLEEVLDPDPEGTVIEVVIM
jgi:hypothetical protein